MSGKQDIMSEMLTAQEAADALGYHIDHLYRLLRAGTIPAERFSGVWAISRTEVERIKALQSKGGRFYPDREEEDTQES
jgi:excisionase family DNA binding protein